MLRANIPVNSAKYVRWVLPFFFHGKIEIDQQVPKHSGPTGTEMELAWSIS